MIVSRLDIFGEDHGSIVLRRAAAAPAAQGRFNCVLWRRDLPRGASSAICTGYARRLHQRPGLPRKVRTI